MELSVSETLYRAADLIEERGCASAARSRAELVRSS